MVVTLFIHYRKKITYLAPSAGELPSKYLIVGTLTWLETWLIYKLNFFFFVTESLAWCFKVMHWPSDGCMLLLLYRSIVRETRIQMLFNFPFYQYCVSYILFIFCIATLSLWSLIQISCSVLVFQSLRTGLSCTPVALRPSYV